MSILWWIICAVFSTGEIIYVTTLHTCRLLTDPKHNRYKAKDRVSVRVSVTVTITVKNIDIDRFSVRI